MLSWGRYKHGVIQDLTNSSLLRDVRQEIQDNLSFTPKETDIYKIHQSGDLANLDGLDDTSLKLLPSLVKLRKALYSKPFRDYLSHVTGSGTLSGQKTDMAVNVYTPSCHLLCHDDVIGSRRVSYILYLTDPDRPWQAEWGGALRLYPTGKMQDEDGSEMRVPSAQFTKVIPPAFNQMSFFAVQPGESFHDVEEVYARVKGEDEDDGCRVRMAISGWFHIPQEGEEGYEEGAQEKQAARSSLAQLQGKTDRYDLPQTKWQKLPQVDEAGEIELTKDDLDFLIKYMNPRYLTPDTVEDLSEQFSEWSTLNLGQFLSKGAETDLQRRIKALEANLGDNTPWKVARPPHKHRFLYHNADVVDKHEPIDQLIKLLFPSRAFHKWLALATGLSLGDCNILARRFRRGLDYTLATSYDQPEPQLEVCLGMTPTEGWGTEDDDDDSMSGDGQEIVAGEIEDGSDKNGDMDADTNGTYETNGTNGTNGRTYTNGTKETKGTPSKKKSKVKEPLEDSGGVGGYEMYMAGDEDDDDAGSDHGVSIPSSHTGAGKRREKVDPAIYQAGDDEDDGILVTNPASWNTLSIVLRDQGTLKFVKYVSKSAQGDRWDITGEWKVIPDADDE